MQLPSTLITNINNKSNNKQQQNCQRRAITSQPSHNTEGESALCLALLPGCWCGAARRAVLCCAVLCCAVLCCAMLCYAVLLGGAAIVFPRTFSLAAILPASLPPYLPSSLFRSLPRLPDCPPPHTPRSHIE
ncbi:hypothetical protein E2C01_068675 [Portunus trituberculatus]|uniref:Uncharacterized protein n=1 Tax=Portunus trituberculatus TaxID=210409 RepID=A0A5B7I042_PORTR|nr:hypothetical protein [Portunus trituberculatus]